MFKSHKIQIPVFELNEWCFNLVYFVISFSLPFSQCSPPKTSIFPFYSYFTYVLLSVSDYNRLNSCKCNFAESVSLRNTSRHGTYPDFHVYFQPCPVRIQHSLNPFKVRE